MQINHLAILCCFFLSCAALAQPSFTVIGPTQYPPGGSITTTSRGLRISADGQYVLGNMGNFFEDVVAFRWSSQFGTELIPPAANSPGPYSYAQAISGDGGTVALEYEFPGFDASVGLYSTSGGYSRVGSTGEYWQVTHLSGDGAFATGVSGQEDIFRRLPDGSIQHLGRPTGASGAFSTGMSNDGSVIVGYGNNGTSFRWDVGGMVTLTAPTANETLDLTALSGDGSTAFGLVFSSAGYRAVRWSTTEGLTELGFEGTPLAATFDGATILTSMRNGTDFDLGLWNA